MYFASVFSVLLFLLLYYLWAISMRLCNASCVSAPEFLDNDDDAVWLCCTLLLCYESVGRCVAPMNTFIRRTASEMTYIVSGGALNSTHSLTHVYSPTMAAETFTCRVC